MTTTPPPSSSLPTLAMVAMTAIILATPDTAAAVTRFVASHGVDGAGCGTKAEPCRSLSRAIALAAPGDTIEVGPGRYGDLDGDGDFTDPGDETAEIDTGCDCIVHVDKRLTIVSRLGAGATVIDGRAQPADIVRVDAPGSVFGKKGKGFTLTLGGAVGIRASADGSVVVANVLSANSGAGLRSDGADRIVVTDNRAIGNADDGFGCSGTNDSFFARNLSTNNVERGFTVDNGNTLIQNLAVLNGEEGFNAQSRNVLTGNVATRNLEEGFNVNDDNVFTADLAVGNHNGFRLDADNLVTKCAAIDNAGAGILVEDQGNVITKSSITGNGGGATGVPVANANCGTSVLAGITLQATSNFWGAADGPGADPADLACNDTGGATVVVPFATKEITIRTKAAR